MALIPLGANSPGPRKYGVADQIPWTADQTVSVKTISQPFTIDNTALATMDCDRKQFEVVQGDRCVSTNPNGNVNTLYPPGGVSP